ncbi:hypothetical protein AWC31_12045 [Mycolicibacterium wolinskyi]|uniref:Uncharacterized protein n=1 Tax=Mycolicibacterium wolinskyi TaxID=59750 RepID=A0A132PKG2_9MYCO|nr:hypothetical protein AFM11_17975 [Mycolicibacterium wolinskyi]ORX18722.1 hypothetical protein AWC31_12045 [Mycolicibacterium wolinskyi]
MNSQEHAPGASSGSKFEYCATRVGVVPGAHTFDMSSQCGAARPRHVLVPAAHTTAYAPKE